MTSSALCRNNPLYTVEAVALNEKSPAAQWVAATPNADGIEPISIRSAGDLKTLAELAHVANSGLLDQHARSPLNLRQALRIAKGLRATAHELTQHAQTPHANMARHWPSERATVHLNERFAGLSRVANRLADKWQLALGERVHESPVPCRRVNRHCRNRYAAVIADLPQQRDLWCWQVRADGHWLSAIHEWLCLQPDGAFRLTADAAPRLTLLAECIEAEVLLDLAWRNGLEEVHAYLPLDATPDDERIMRERLAIPPEVRAQRLLALQERIERWVETRD